MINVSRKSKAYMETIEGHKINEATNEAKSRTTYRFMICHVLTPSDLNKLAKALKTRKSLGTLGLKKFGLGSESVTNGQTYLGRC